MLGWAVHLGPAKAPRRQQPPRPASPELEVGRQSEVERRASAAQALPAQAPSNHSYDKSPVVDRRVL
eukprot:5431408-Alexandrium_andersonii.AAC.1